MSSKHQVNLTVDNTNNSGSLTLQTQTASHGSYTSQFPTVIAGGQTAESTLEANAGLYGAEGTATFSAGGGTLTLKFGNPVSADNYFSYQFTGSGLTFGWQGSTDGKTWTPGEVPASGSPVYIQFSVVDS